MNSWVIVVDPLALEIGAALYQNVEDQSNREKILTALNKVKDKERILRLAQNETERLNMEIALHLTSRYHRHRLDLSSRLLLPSTLTLVRRC